MNTITDLIHKYFAAYESKDRAALEETLCADFTFTSPFDDRIDREYYLEICWPNSEHQQVFRIERLFAQGNEAFVTYQCERHDGQCFRNTEFFGGDGEKIRHIDVYFGSDNDHR